MSRLLFAALALAAASVPMADAVPALAPDGRPEPPLPYRGQAWKKAPYHPPSPGTRQRKARKARRQGGGR